MIKLLERIDRTHLVVALFVWLVSLVVYIKTSAPTLSFWDCGEFVAVSVILGIPHPPGAPLYVIIGRIFSLLPFFDDVGARVNLLSAVSSSFTALFCYLSGVRILRFWFGGNTNGFTSFVILGGSACGAFLAAFGITNWSNSVEAEVYGLSMMIFTAIMWLTLVYLDSRSTVGNQRIMLLIFYLAFLGIGAHMTTFLVLPIVAWVFIMKKETPAYIWYMLAAFVAFELYLIFALSSRPSEVPFYVPILIVFVVFMFFIFSFEQIRGLYLVVVGGMVLSIAPIYGIIYKSVLTASGREVNISESTQLLLDYLGGISFIALILFAFFCLSRYWNFNKLRQPAAHYLHVAMFVLAAALMTALILIDQIKGYESFLILSVVLTAILMIVIYRHINWPMLFATIGLLMIVLGIHQFFYGVVGSVIVLLVGGLILKWPGWRTALMIVLVSVLGFSSHLFIPIRSELQPAINENNPSTGLDATINYLERKQYGSESMVDRMFVRRGEWTNQFGNFHRMGFWKCFSEQLGINGPAFVFPFLVGVFGLWEILRQRGARGVVLLLLLLISSVGLVLYMNFADGTRQQPVSGADYLEVRERDYFFTPSYILFGLCIGIGVAGIIHYVKESTKALKNIYQKIALGAASLLLLLPVISFATNYDSSDRTGNYVPYDYGWDLLNSADENAVLFTSGDNDTFPLWCLQQAYGVRKDVRIVNLSLANTDWYIKQLHLNLGLRFNLSDEEIERLRPFRTTEGTIFKIHHQVIDKIIEDNFKEIPINFSVTVGSDNRRYRGHSIDSLLSLKGFTWRVNNHLRHLGTDVEEGYEFFMNPDKFKCRGANDPKVYLDDTSDKLARNLANGFLVLADTLRKAKDYQRAENLVMRARTLIPKATDPIQLLARIFSEQNDIERLKTLTDTCKFEQKEVLYMIQGQTYRRLENDAQAENALNQALNLNPTYRPAFDELMRMYLGKKQYPLMRAGIMRWLQFNPNDQQVREIYQQMEKSMGGSDSAVGKSE